METNSEIRDRIESNDKELELQKIVDKLHNNLLDGMKLNGYKRTFTSDEYEMIDAIFLTLNDRIKRKVY